MDNRITCRWRVCQSDLNLEGYCRNVDCDAHDDLVIFYIFPAGFVSFSLKVDKVSFQVLIKRAYMIVHEDDMFTKQRNIFSSKGHILQQRFLIF